MSLCPSTVASGGILPADYYFALKSDIAPPQVLSQNANTVSLSGGGGAVNIASTSAVALSTQKLTAVTYDTGLLETNVAGVLNIGLGSIIGDTQIEGGRITVQRDPGEPQIEFVNGVNVERIKYDGTKLLMGSVGISGEIYDNFGSPGAAGQQLQSSGPGLPFVWGAGSGVGLTAVVAGTNIGVDNTNPIAPVVSVNIDQNLNMNTFNINGTGGLQNIDAAPQQIVNVVQNTTSGTFSQIQMSENIVDVQTTGGNINLTSSTAGSAAIALNSGGTSILSVTDTAGVGSFDVTTQNGGILSLNARNANAAITATVNLGTASMSLTDTAGIGDVAFNGTGNFSALMFGGNYNFNGSGAGAAAVNVDGNLTLKGTVPSVSFKNSSDVVKAFIDYSESNDQLYLNCAGVVAAESVAYGSRMLLDTGGATLSSTDLPTVLKRSETGGGTKTIMTLEDNQRITIGETALSGVPTVAIVAPDGNEAQISYTGGSGELKLAALQGNVNVSSDFGNVLLTGNEVVAQPVSGTFAVQSSGVPVKVRLFDGLNDSSITYGSATGMEIKVESAASGDFGITMKPANGIVEVKSDNTLNYPPTLSFNETSTAATATTAFNGTALTTNLPGGLNCVLDSSTFEITTTASRLKVNGGVVEGVQIGTDGVTNFVAGYGLPLKIVHNDTLLATDYIELSQPSVAGVCKIVQTENIELATPLLTFTGAALQSNTAGGNSGEHLVITLNGVVYKIKLENP